MMLLLKLSCICKSPGILLKCSFWFIGGGGAWGSAFVISSQVVLILAVPAVACLWAARQYKKQLTTHNSRQTQGPAREQYSVRIITPPLTPGQYVFGFLVLAMTSGVTGISYLEVKDATNPAMCEIIQVDCLRLVPQSTELSCLKCLQHPHQGTVWGVCTAIRGHSLAALPPSLALSH